jgi:hypothetical protein
MLYLFNLLDVPQLPCLLADTLLRPVESEDRQPILAGLDSVPLGAFGPKKMSWVPSVFVLRLLSWEYRPTSFMPVMNPLVFVL